MNFDITVLLDRSGSMETRKHDHIGGLRSFINDQKGQEGQTNFTLVQFDTNEPFELVFDGVNIQDVDTEKVNLIPRGGTPLLDAVGKTIAHIETRIKGKEKETQVVLMVITDGEENSSREWTRDRIAKAIKDKENDWKILYLGANVDAFAEAGSFGMSAGAVMNYSNTVTGCAAVYNVGTTKLNNMRGMYNAGFEKTAVVLDHSTSFTAEDRVMCAADDQNLVNQVTNLNIIQQ